ncbi:MAG TPA: hypothetical protein VMA31_02735 [Bryobacteraceae bacterium]|nr:hypothetical protein [Bryobacteraceae bacterium]
MFGFLAVLLYLVAIGIPVFLLHRFHAQSWFWHVLAVAAAIAVGFLPTPPSWKTEMWDLGFGFAFLLLLVWGVGGLIVLRPHRHRHEKHA